MCITMYYLLDRFPENLRELSEDQDEQFHQNLKIMEERCWDILMMVAYCWSFQGICPETTLCKMSLKRHLCEMSE